MASATYFRPLAKSLNTKNMYSSVPWIRFPNMRHPLMFGSAATIPIPDIDRTDFFLMLGANPFVSKRQSLHGP
ncbi:MAG: hypothetical protein R2861_07260 [Desulfobacterales bacterium]